MDPLLVARDLLAKKNVSKFEIYFLHRSGTDIEAKDGKIETFERSEDRAISVRVLQGRRSGFAFSTSLSKSDLGRMVDAAVASAQLMPEDPTNDLPEFSAHDLPAMNLDDAASARVSVTEKTERALELERMTRAADPRVRGVRSASISEAVGTRSLLNHTGTRLEATSRLFTSSVSCKAEADGDAQMGGSFRHARSWARLNWKDTATEAALRACELLGATQGATLQCPAVLRNDVMAELVGFLSESFSAEAIAKGRSLLLGREGTRVFSERIRLIDDALLEDGYASRPFDGEGTPSRTLAVVENGVFANALYDSEYARKSKKTSTGHAVRDFRAPPSIGTTNFYMPAGDLPFEDLLRKAGNGILVTELMGVHTANPVTGDFSLGASGIAIKSGALAGPLRGFAVAGNLLKLLENVESVGSDLQFFGSVGAPSLLVPSLAFGGA